MERTFEGWDKAIWEQWALKLEQLSVEQLRSLTQAVGLSFGNRQPESKAAYILVLDEVSPEVLEEQYRIIIR